MRAVPNKNGAFKLVSHNALLPKVLGVGFHLTHVVLFALTFPVSDVVAILFLLPDIRRLLAEN